MNGTAALAGWHWWREWQHSYLLLVPSVSFLVRNKFERFISQAKVYVYYGAVTVYYESNVDYYS